MKLPILTIVAAAALALPPLAHAQSSSYGAAVGSKTVNAVANVLYSPFDPLVTSIAWMLDFEEHENVGAWTGSSVAYVPGVMSGAIRLMEGTFDLVTFPFASKERDYSFQWFLVPPRPRSGFVEHDSLDP